MIKLCNEVKLYTHLATCNVATLRASKEHVIFFYDKNWNLVENGSVKKINFNLKKIENKIHTTKSVNNKNILDLL